MPSVTARQLALLLDGAGAVLLLLLLARRPAAAGGERSVDVVAARSHAPRSSRGAEEHSLVSAAVLAWRRL